MIRRLALASDIIEKTTHPIAPLRAKTKMEHCNTGAIVRNRKMSFIRAMSYFSGGTNAMVRAKNQHRKNTTGSSTIKYNVE